MNVSIKSRTWLSTDFAKSTLESLIGARSRLIGIICTATVAGDDAIAILWASIGATGIDLPLVVVRQSTVGYSRIALLGGASDSNVVLIDPVTAPPAEGIYGSFPVMPQNQWKDVDGNTVSLKLTVANVATGIVTILYTEDQGSNGEYV